MNRKQREIEKLGELLGEFDTAMLTTKSGDGSIRSRPMHLARTDDDGDVWFLTNLGSGKLDELREDPRVNVSMQGKGTFLSLSGTAEVVSERRTLDELWTPALKPWFPAGTDSPDMAAIHVEAHEAEYWDRSGSNGLAFAFEAARAVVEGRKPHDDPPTRHGHLEV